MGVAAVIIKRTRGVDAVKALAYDYGPGRKMEHHNPRRVAGTVAGRDWRDRARTMQTKLRADGDTVSPSERAAVRALQKQQRERAAKEGKKAGRGPSAGRGRVIRLAVNAAPEDRVMSDREWSDIARRVVGEFTKDADGYAWEAVRHDPRHIHITLLQRGHDGKLLSENNDQYRYGRISAGLERDYELRPVNHTRTDTPERKRARAAAGAEAKALHRSTSDQPRPVRVQHDHQAGREDRAAAALAKAQRRQAQRERDGRDRGGRER